MDMPTIETLKRARIKWLDVSFSYKAPVYNSSATP